MPLQSSTKLQLKFSKKRSVYYHFCISNIYLGQAFIITQYADIKFVQKLRTKKNVMSICIYKLFPSSKNISYYS